LEPIYVYDNYAVHLSLNLFTSCSITLNTNLYIAIENFANEALEVKIGIFRYAHFDFVVFLSLLVKSILYSLPTIILLLHKKKDKIQLSPKLHYSKFATFFPFHTSLSNKIFMLSSLHS